MCLVQTSQVYTLEKPVQQGLGTGQTCYNTCSQLSFSPLMWREDKWSCTKPSIQIDALISGNYFKYPRKTKPRNMSYAQATWCPVVVQQVHLEKAGPPSKDMQQLYELWNCPDVNKAYRSFNHACLWRCSLLL